MLLIFYIVLTASFVIYNLPGRIGNSLSGDPGGKEAEYQVQETENVDRVRDRFHAVGGLQQDFRRDGAQVIRSVSGYWGNFLYYRSMKVVVTYFYFIKSSPNSR